jgi:hydroxypyruvate isomerase
MQIMEGDLATSIQSHLQAIAHVQIADPPARHEPGTGEINFAYLFGLLDRLKYPGWIGCEYKPGGRTEDGLGWMRSLVASR